MAEFEKQREKSGRKKSTLLPRNSTNFSTENGGSIPPHHPLRANERNGRKKNGVKKIEKKEETTTTYTLYTHCTRTVHKVKGRGTTARRKSFSSWRGTNCRGARTRAIQSVRGADLREAREQRARIPIGTVGYFIATGPQRLVKINT